MRAGRVTDLPRDLLARCLAPLSYRDAAAAASSCRGLRAAAEEVGVWESIYTRAFAGVRRRVHQGKQGTRRWYMRG